MLYGWYFEYHLVSVWQSASVPMGMPVWLSSATFPKFTLLLWFYSICLCWYSTIYPAPSAVHGILTCSLLDLAFIFVSHLLYVFSLSPFGCWCFSVAYSSHLPQGFFSCPSPAATGFSLNIGFCCSLAALKFTRFLPSPFPFLREWTFLVLLSFCLVPRCCVNDLGLLDPHSSYSFKNRIVFQACIAYNHLIVFQLLTPSFIAFITQHLSTLRLHVCVCAVCMFACAYACRGQRTFPVSILRHIFHTLLILCWTLDWIWIFYLITIKTTHSWPFVASSCLFSTTVPSLGFVGELLHFILHGRCRDSGSCLHHRRHVTPLISPSLATGIFLLSM